MMHRFPCTAEAECLYRNGNGGVVPFSQFVDCIDRKWRKRLLKAGGPPDTDSRDRTSLPQAKVKLKRHVAETGPGVNHAVDASGFPNLLEIHADSCANCGPV